MTNMLCGRVAAAVLAGAALFAFAPGASAQSNAQIKQRLIRQSIAAYSGACPCPYSTMRNGARCGGRSAYSRPGGAAPLCYPSDVSAAQVRAARGR